MVAGYLKMFTSLIRETFINVLFINNIQHLKQQTMKYIPFSIILLWSIWAIYENRELTPKQNYFLWYLSVFSVTYSVVNLAIFFIKLTDKIHKKWNKE